MTHANHASVTTSTLRDRRRHETLDAFRDFAREGNAVNISVPSVAKTAGVSVRTVYR
jgi:AcrR family transcriptional regulator